MREVRGNLQVFLEGKKRPEALKKVGAASLQYLILADIQDAGIRITGMGMGDNTLDFSFSTVESPLVPYKQRISKVLEAYGLEKFRITNNH